MTIEFGTLIKVGIILYLLILVFLIVGKKYSLKQHILFFLSFCLYIAFLNVMLFPIEVEDFNSMPYIEARQYKHTPIPFSYIIRNLQGEDSIEAFHKTYFTENPTLEQRQESLLIMKDSLHQIFLFILANFTIIVSLVLTRLLLVNNRLSTKRALLFPIALTVTLDIAYIIKYYLFSLDVEGFDSSFILFQFTAFFVGFLLYLVSKQLVRVIMHKD